MDRYSEDRWSALLRVAERSCRCHSFLQVLGQDLSKNRSRRRLTLNWTPHCSGYPKVAIHSAGLVFPLFGEATAFSVSRLRYNVSYLLDRKIRLTTGSEGKMWGTTLSLTVNCENCHITSAWTQHISELDQLDISIN